MVPLGANSELRLSSWTRSRRVVLLRRRMSDELHIKEDNGEQLRLGFCLDDRQERRYEYAVLVTSLDALILPLAQLYRDRADCENHFDELKNQWGWGGYTTHDLKRCRLISRMVALIYNWWSLFSAPCATSAPSSPPCASVRSS